MQSPKPSRSGSKRKPGRHGGINRPGLAVDTSFTKHQAEAPKQVFPYESKTQELTFVSIPDARLQKSGRKSSLRAELENRLPFRPSANRSLSDTQQSHQPGHARPTYDRAGATTDQSCDVRNDSTSSRLLPLHKRIRGLRPSPLDLSNDISPSDRAITIGIAIPSQAVSEHNETPQATLQPHWAQQVQTPTIVITPAKEDFDMAEVSDLARRDYRASSVYSRYTNGGMRRRDTPPVPPLPLFVGKTRRGPGLTIAPTDSSRNKPRDTAISAVTLFEEDDELHSPPASARTFTSQSHLPTPRRSKGWWNVITSPFSAGSKSHAGFWRSPSPLDDDEDRQSMLRNAADMNTAGPHAGVIFTNRGLDDNEVRSALPVETSGSRPIVPKRSDTAPGALDGSEAAVNIYRVPSQGLAAAYYDPTRHFPSLIVDSATAEAMRGSMVGWSPSHSVAHPDDRRSLRLMEPKPAGLVNASKDLEIVDGRSHPFSMHGDITQSPEYTSETGATPKEPAHAAGAERNIFSTPSVEELHETGSARPTAQRGATDATLASHFSPLSPTPILESAHMATYMGPQSTNGELREVQLTPARMPSPLSPRQTDRSLEGVNFPPQDHGYDPTATKGFMRPKMHERNDSSSSLGLGITDGEKELYPPQRTFVERPRLGTDRFGQLTITKSEKAGPVTPWHRRFFWLLASIVAFMLLMLVILLVMLIPQAQNDMAVQASWTNLTGFPSLPTGIATFIQPSLAKKASGCVNPESLWSCAVPAGQQVESEVPNFRFEIRFRNGTLPRNETQLARRSSVIANAGSLARRDGLTGSLFTADPAAPSKGDQSFMGQYVDNITVPYEGEQTPFYFSLLDPAALDLLGSRLRRRHEGSPYPYPNLVDSNSTSNATTNAANSIPKPALQANGKPAESELYPYASAQPLRLYNRGKDNEHYGFYTYFDRSLLISNITSTSSTTNNGLSNSLNSDVPLANASAVCTWSQTRLHFQIWTKKGTVASLSDVIPLNGLPAANGTANDMTAPGSFPYPVTVTIDRHGGQASKKGVYCYGLDAEQRVVESVKTWIGEDRGFDGRLVNAAMVPGSNGTGVQKRGSDGAGKYGGVDGGTGGYVSTSIM
ncbi:hypothetical protein LTR78_004707 [Recurvomyces mirabilis]|uniref:Glycoprotease family protein n=1 Tax=Recurvomyces mirabilis TaxID=574656 RepID=A0AAE1C2L6_9PEZI|nr:hypothetical protein LTR78_004707 [Recurvomyces mirabilis]KAK5152799.1 hypothetical protein LTS14_007906 [Recurvomyces mirabilis]